MLSILGLVVVVVATYFSYKTARDNGRNGFIWGLITFCVGFGMQIVVPLLIGIVLGIVWVATGTPTNELQSKIQGPALVIGIVTLVLSLVGMGLVLRYVSSITDDSDSHLPPPPAKFDINQ